MTKKLWIIGAIGAGSVVVGADVSGAAWVDGGAVDSGSVDAQPTASTTHEARRRRTNIDRASQASAVGAFRNRYGRCVRRQDKADRIGEMLDDLYPDPLVPLDHTSPYTLLVAVALSAQTTDKKVNEVTPALFAVADTPEKMVRLEPEEILALIREIGLAPTKARNLRRMAEQIIDGGGEVIPDWDFLESLAGVGHKTASVVMSQAFGEPAFAVDTHIHRLADRWGLSNGTTVERTERDLKAVFPRDTWNRRHLQIIFFGREYCPAQRHDLALCPICGWAATAKRIREESGRTR